MWRMNEKEERFAKSDLGDEFIKIEKKLGFIIIKDERILTAAHQTRRSITKNTISIQKSINLFYNIFVSRAELILSPTC